MQFSKNGKLILLLYLMFTSLSCGLHFKVHNPKKAGRYPEFTDEQIALGSDNKWRNCFDVHHYALDIRLDVAQKQLSGWVAITATMTAVSDSVQIDLGKTLVIDSICWQQRNGHPINYRRQHRAILLSLPESLKSGETFTIFVKYHGQPGEARKAPWEGGMVWKKDKQGQPWAGVACESEGASTWFPCKDVTYDEPDSADLHFSLPESNLTAVSNGTFEGKESHNGYNTFKWTVRNPINLYNITFYIGDYVRIEDTLVSPYGKLNINHYVLRLNENKAREHFKAAKEHIRIYESLYGPYAWYSDGFKLVESPYAGMEHQTAIAYGNGYKNDLQGGKEDYIMLHEIGHEWFGNAVTAADLADVWLQEGITTYGEALYLEKKYGKRDADKHMLFYRFFIKNKRPLVGPTERRYFDYNDGDVYVKGAWMLQSLRATINNDSLFFAALKTFYQHYTRKVTNSKDFIAVINEVTGKDYNWFFRQYLYNNKVPILEYVQKNGVLYYRWVSVSDDFKEMPTLLTKQNGEHITLYPSTQTQTLVLNADGSEAPFSFMETTTLHGVKKNKTLSLAR